MSDTKEELKRMVASIADKLEGFVNSEERYCSDCGIFYDDCDESHEEHYTYDLYDYIMDNLGVRLVVEMSDESELVGVIIAMVSGELNIYINTFEGEVQGYWGCDRATCRISRDVQGQIEEMINEMRVRK